VSRQLFARMMLMVIRVVVEDAITDG